MSLPVIRYLILAALVSACGTRADEESQSVLASDHHFDSRLLETNRYLPETAIVHAANTVTDRSSNTQANFRIAPDNRAVFKSPWMTLFGLIYGVAGQRIYIDYRREPWTLGQTGEIVGVRMQYRVPGESQVQDLPSISQLDRAFQFEVPTDATKVGALEYWFLVKFADGSEIYDSRFGQNYAVMLLPPACALLSFDAVQDPGNWPAVTVQGSLKGDGALCVSYEKSRAYALGLQDNWYRGATIAPSVRGYARYFDAQNNVANEVEFYPNHKGDRVALPVPKGTKRISVWFHASEYGGKEAYDSRFGVNYNYDVQ